MQILSALDAVSPAIARTRLVLFTPFRLGRTWKLSVTSYFAFAGTLFFPLPLILFIPLPSLHLSQGRFVLDLVPAAILLLTALYVFLFHLCSRLQFAFFDIVLNRGEFVAPAWRKYGPQSRLWTTVKIAAGTLACLCMAAPVIAYVHHLTALATTMKTFSPGDQPPPDFIAGFFAGYFIIALGFGAFFLLISTVSAFILPSLALENTSLAEAFRRFFKLVRQEPGEFIVYVLVKIGLGLTGYIGSSIVIQILLFVLGGIFLALGAAVGFALHAAGVSTSVLIALAIAAGVIAYLILLWAVVFAIGPLFTFLQAYTLYFLGGRYPMLGDLLDASTPVRSAPVPHPMPASGPPYAYTPPPPSL